MVQVKVVKLMTKSVNVFSDTVCFLDRKMSPPAM